MSDHHVRRASRECRRVVRERRGSALILVLVAMVVLLVLSSGALFGSMAELRMSRTLSVQQRAQSVAEYGMNAQLASWPVSRNALANGAIDSLAVVVQTGDTARVRVQRLTSRTFNVVSIGRAAVGNGLLEAQRQTSMLVRISGASMTSRGLVTIYNKLDVQGSPLLDGTNVAPSGWSCSGYSTADTVAVAYNAANVPSIQKANQTVGGTRASTPAADTSTYSVFGSETWSSLVAKASVTTSGSPNPSPTGTATTCTTSATNWGEPNRNGGAVVGCQNYFPIIYSSGDLTLNNGRGQGILLVNGRLRVTGNFVFAGIVVVRDNLDFAGTPTFYGSVLVRGANGAQSDIKGNATFQYSSCAIGQAMLGSATPRRASLRSWAQIY